MVAPGPTQVWLARCKPPPTRTLERTSQAYLMNRVRLENILLVSPAPILRSYSRSPSGGGGSSSVNLQMDKHSRGSHWRNSSESRRTIGQGGGNWQTVHYRGEHWREGARDDGWDTEEVKLSSE
jgi:hypothetical protein